MKKLILIAASFLATTTVTLAQEAAKDKPASETKSVNTPELQAQKNVDELNAQVSLTEEQKPKVYEISLEKVKKIHEIREKYKGQNNREAMRPEMDAVKKAYHEKLKTILTAQQFEKMKAARHNTAAEAKPASVE